MRASQFLIATLKETPSDAEVISHQLMLRAGMIRKLASGLYNWLPLGLRVLRRVETVVREEMNRSGAQEVLMPVVQPSELWQESGRWEQYGFELLRMNDRHQREFCLGPTHEEVITDIARNEIKSYKQLPLNFYQIQTKFRDEIRPRFGVMRAREFVMKDAYSFHKDEASLQQTYDEMYQAYSRIFSRLGLDFRAVIADTGSIGGQGSHEFHVLASSGEDDIAFSDSSDYAANVEMAEALADKEAADAPSQDMQSVATPGVSSIDSLCEQLKIAPETTLKTLLVAASEECEAEFVALLLRGDHQLNDIKAEKLAEVASPLRMATEEEVERVMGAKAGSIGPVNPAANVYRIADRSAAVLSDFVCGANQNEQHLTGVNWQRDAEFDAVADIRNVVDGDPSPDGQGQIRIRRGIEVGHIFQLGKKYSEALQARVLDENGREQAMIMGCYGIGVSRVVAAAIEQNHDDKGIIWPAALAPFDIAIVPMNAHKSERVREQAEALYASLTQQGYEVLLDDRQERPGIKFADIELMGIPHRLVIGDRGLDQGELEYRHRRADDNEMLPLDNIEQALQERLSQG